MISSVSGSSSWVSNLFSKLDTKSQGYLEKSDLETAFSAISSDSTTTSIDDLFTQLDTDSDGKVTEQEMTSSLQQLADQLDSGFNNMRTSGMGGMGSMPPPPPPKGAEDAGFTEEELTAQLEEIGSTDSARSSLISSIVSNFDEADTDDDGKVSMQEAMAYDQLTSSTSATSSTSTTSVAAADSSSTTTTNDTAEADVMFRIMQLMHAYGFAPGTDASSSSLSVSA